MVAFCVHHQSDHDQESLVERLNRVAAQPAHAADRFAREIVGFLKVIGGALAAADGQTVSWHNDSSLIPTSFKLYRW
jgi:hypothetical protein